MRDDVSDKDVWLFICIFVVVGILLMIMTGQRDNLRVDVRNLEERLSEYRKQHQFVSGSDKENGNYKIMTIDGGINWYAYETSYKDGIISLPQVKILGPADDFYPGAAAEHMAWEAILKYTKENGLSIPSSAEGLGLLEDAGFEVIVTREDL
jgi:hypothetical protein